MRTSVRKDRISLYCADTINANFKNSQANIQFSNNMLYK